MASTSKCTAKWPMSSCAIQFRIEEEPAASSLDPVRRKPSLTSSLILGWRALVKSRIHHFGSGDGNIDLVYEVRVTLTSSIPRECLSRPSQGCPISDLLMLHTKHQARNSLAPRSCANPLHRFSHVRQTSLLPPYPGQRLPRYPSGSGCRPRFWSPRLPCRPCG